MERHARLALLAASLAFAACSGAPAPSGGCQSDADCPGHAICNAGHCQLPVGSGSGSGGSSGAASSSGGSSGGTGQGGSTSGAGVSSSSGSGSTSGSGSSSSTSSTSGSGSTGSGGSTSGGSTSGGSTSGGSTSGAVDACGGSCKAPFACDQASALCKNQGVPQLSHVWIIVMENTNYSDINATNSPYIAGTLFPQAVQMQNYYAVTHPSTPNYIAMVGGDTFGMDGSDGPASNPSFQVPAGNPDIATQLEAAGFTWHEYSESQQVPCAIDDTGSDPTKFVSKHDPMPHFLITQGTASCNANDVSFDANGSMPGMIADVQAGTFYNYNYIAPNLCNDGHDLCSGASSKVSEQDAWLQNNLKYILQSRAYQQSGLVIITWDENDNTGGGAVYNQIATLYLSPMLASPGGTNSTQYSHYSMLATVEAGFGLANLPAANNHNDALITDIWK